MLSSRESDFFLEDWRVRPQLNVLESPAGDEISVEPKSMEVLICLARHGGKVVRKRRLIEEVWVETFVGDDALTHAIWELRKTLGDDRKNPRFIKTVPRRGYQLVGRVNRLEAPPAGEDLLVDRYRVGEKLGGGAMGVVFGAEDTRLRRKVALKFLAPELVRDTEAQARFLREAQAASSLHHPSICTVYDIGETPDGGVYLAMAYYEGQTLQNRLASGAMPTEEVLEVAAQIAEALAAAHAQGIVHRDLKPANVLLTSEGRAVLLDFGLAKLLDRRQLTRSGRPLGTPAYMAPEQARGEEIDHRVDLWALGVVLYQMLSGKLPFGGHDSNAILYAITHEEPRPLESPVELPSGVTALLERLLRKEPDQRCGDTAGLAKDLRKWASPELATRSKPPEERQRWAPPTIRFAAVFMLVAAGAGAAWLLVDRMRARPTPVAPTFAPFTTDGGWKDTPRLSPDGERVAFAWRGPTEDLDIYVKALGLGAEPLRLTDHPADEAFPVFSPDGRQIAYVRIGESERAIYLVPSHGGRQRKLIDLVGRVSGDPVLTWSPDGGQIAFSEQIATNEPARIVALSLATLEKEPLTTPPAGIGGDFGPEFSPDGRQLAFCRRAAPVWGDNDIWIRRENGELLRVTAEHFNSCHRLAWTPNGEDIVFSLYLWQGRRLHRVRVSEGVPEPVVGIGASGHAHIVERRMVYQELAEAVPDIWRVPGRTSTTPERSPERLVSSSTLDLGSVFSPDGTRIALASYRSGRGQIWLVESDGSSPTQLTDLDREAGSPTWSPDGRRIAFDSLQSGSYDVWVVDAQGGLPQQLTFEASEDGTASWSRDGRWIYFHSDRSGENQIWKIPATGGEAVQVTREGGFFAQESWDGQTLFFVKSAYTAGDVQSIWRMPVEGGGEKQLSASVDDARNWDVSRSGVYFLESSKQGASLMSFEGGFRADYTLRFLDLTTGRVSNLFHREGVVQLNSLAVSPDEDWILYTEIPTSQAELVLIEGFR